MVSVKMGDKRAALKDLTREQKAAIVGAEMTVSARRSASSSWGKYQWEWWARDDQLEPQGRWNVWLFMAGARRWEDSLRC
jgi:hypothetical protein